MVSYAKSAKKSFTDSQKKMLSGTTIQDFKTPFLAMTKKHELEEAYFRLISEGVQVDGEIMTRRQAARINESYRKFNRSSVWVEYKQPVHISKVLEQEFIRLQQSINR